MRLAFVVPGSLDAASGGYRYDRKLRAGLSDRGWEIDVHSVASRGYHRRIRTAVSRRFVRELTADDYDIILQDELAHPNLFGLNPRLRRHTDAPIVALVHSLRDCDPTTPDRLGLARAYESRYLRGVDGYVFNSRASRAAVARWIDPRPGIVAYPAGPPTSQCRQTSDTETMRLAFIGHLRPIKGIDVLLRSLAPLDAPWDLTVVGGLDRDTQHVASARRLVTQLDIEDRVTFVGELDRSGVADVLATAELLIVPSRYEAYGMVYLEAMTAGVPPVATTAGGASELIEDGRTGYLVPPADHEALTRLLESLLSDPAECDRVGRAAARRAAIHPTWEQTVEDVHRFLCALAA